MIRTLECRQDRLRHGVVALQVEVLVVQGVRGGGGEESYMQMNVGLGWDINIGEEVKGDGGEMVRRCMFETGLSKAVTLTDTAEQTSCLPFETR